MDDRRCVFGGAAQHRIVVHLENGHILNPLEHPALARHHTIAGTVDDLIDALRNEAKVL